MRLQESIRNDVKLVESLVTEYVVQQGSTVADVLVLNLFSDTRTSRLSDYEEDFAKNEEWLAIETSYGRTAYKAEKALAQFKDRTIDNMELAREIDGTSYDGSDAYDNVEDAIASLPGIYDNQIEVIKTLLTYLRTGNYESDEY